MLFFLKVSSVFLLGVAAACWGGCRRAPAEDGNRIVYALWGSVEQLKAEHELIRAFREEHPEIEVKTVAIGSRYADKIQAMMVGGVAPDVIMVEMSFYDEWAARGVLVDLTEQFHELHEESPLLPVPYRAFARREGIFALPVNCHGFATYYNEEALLAAGVEIPEEGLTWSYLREIAPKLSRRAGDPAALTEYALLLHNYWPIFWQHGARLFDDPEEPRRVAVNTPEAVAALDFIREVVASGFAVPPGMISDHGTYQLFRDGRVAFYFDGRWRTPEFARKTGLTWEVTGYPSGPVSGVTVHGGTGLAIWEGSAKKEAAMKFVQYYASVKGAALAMREQRYVPVFAELAYGEDFLGLRPPEGIHHFCDTMKEGASRAVLYAPGAQEVSRIFNARIEQALGHPEKSSREVIEGLEADLKRWMERRR